MSAGDNAVAAVGALVPMTVDELAAQLGVDRKTVYALVQRGKVPGVIRLGRLVRFARPVVVAWLTEGQAPRRTASR